MLIDRAKLTKHTLESALTLLLILLFYFLLMALLTRVFPTGVSLKQVVSGDAILSKLHLFGGKDKVLKFTNRSYDQNLDEDSDYYASILEKVNVVKSKSANSVAWTQAGKGMRLRDQDAVQTFAQSAAVIQIGANSYINMDENSLIVINHMENDQLLVEKRTRVVMLAGELRGDMTAFDNEAVQLEVATGAASTRVITAAGGKKTRFSVKVNANKSSTVTVLEGGAEVNAGGQTLRLEQNTAVTIDENSVPSPVQRIPRQVVVVKPAVGADFFYKDFPGVITFDWEQQDDSQQYEFMLAGDREFRNIVLSKITDKTFFNHNNLKAGVYYWKVRGLRGELQGDYNFAREFRVTRDNTPPPLQVKLPGDGTTAGSHVINGRSEANAVVFVNNAPATVDERGNFHYTLQLKKGVNIIVIEALDRAGNVNYASKTITTR